MRKYTKELLEYSKTSALFEYAVKNYSKDKQNQQLMEEVKSAYDYLMNQAFPPIEAIYRSNPDDPDAISVYEIACKDRMQMMNLYNSLLL